MSNAASPITPDDIALMAIAKALADPPDENKPVTRRTLKRARRILAALRALGWRPAPAATQRGLKQQRRLFGEAGPWFSEQEWFSLPLDLRERWWSETNYGDHPPSGELMTKIRARLERGQA